MFIDTGVFRYLQPLSRSFYLQIYEKDANILVLDFNGKSTVLLGNKFEEKIARNAIHNKTYVLKFDFVNIELVRYGTHSVLQVARD